MEDFKFRIIYMLEIISNILQQSEIIKNKYKILIFIRK